MQHLLVRIMFRMKPKAAFILLGQQIKETEVYVSTINPAFVELIYIDLSVHLAVQIIDAGIVAACL